MNGVIRYRKTIATWSPPPRYIMKFNVDGAVGGKPGLAGFGGVLRSLGGNFIGFHRG